MTRRVIVLAVAGLVLASCAPGGGGPGATAAPGGPDPDPGPVDLVSDWGWAPPGPFSPGIPAVSGDDTAATWSHQLLVALDGRGEPRWQAPRLGLLEGAPAFTPTLVLVATEGGLAAYDRLTGRSRWTAEFGERPASPSVAGERVVVTTAAGSVIAVEAATGRVVWRVPLGGPSYGPAAVAGSTVVASFDDGRAAGAAAFDLAGGQRRWAVMLPADGVSAPAISSAGMVVVVAGDAAAHGLALGDGAERWRSALDGSGSAEVPPLARPGGEVVVGHRLGGMAMLDGPTGVLRWASAPHGAAVRGAPVGPGPGGWYAMPLHDGRLLLAGPDRPDELGEASGFVRGAAAGPDGTLVVAVGRGGDNRVMALRGW